MKRPYLLLHIAVLLAGFTGVFGKLISLNEGLLVWYRVIISSVLLFILLKLSRIPGQISGKEKFSIAKTGMLITIHWVFFYGSIKYSNISVGVICYCLTSFFTALFAPVINKRKLELTELALSIFTLFGISLIFHFDTSYQIGIILGVISSAFAALYTIYNERLVRHFDSRRINYYQMIGGMIGLGVLMPVYLYYFPVATLLPKASDLGYLFLLSLFCTVGLYVLFAESLKTIPAFTVNLSFNIEPLYSILLAFLFFNEGHEVAPVFYVGVFFVMLSVVLQTMISRRKEV